MLHAPHASCVKATTSTSPKRSTIKPGGHRLRRGSPGSCRSPRQPVDIAAQAHGIGDFFGQPMRINLLVRSVNSRIAIGACMLSMPRPTNSPSTPCTSTRLPGRMRSPGVPPSSEDQRVDVFALAFSGGPPAAASRRTPAPRRFRGRHSWLNDRGCAGDPARLPRCSPSDDPAPRA